MCVVSLILFLEIAFKNIPHRESEMLRNYILNYCERVPTNAVDLDQRKAILYDFNENLERLDREFDSRIDLFDAMQYLSNNLF